MDEVGLGKALQKARQAAGLTQQELCQKAKLSYSTLAKIERGAIKAPSIFTIYNIAAALGTNLNDLLAEIMPTESAAESGAQRKSDIKFVYFDINGCLVHFFHRAFGRLAAETGAPAEVIETTFWRHNAAVCRGELPLPEFNRILAEAMGTPRLDWQSYYMEAIDAIPEMHELVRQAAAHYRVGLLSNIMPGFIEDMLARGLLPDVEYAAIIDSSKTGAIKPEDKIYEAAQYYTDCKPEEVLLIDDDRANLMAADKRGWKVLWFDDSRPEDGVRNIRAALGLEA